MKKIILLLILLLPAAAAIPALGQTSLTPTPPPALPRQAPLLDTLQGGQKDAFSGSIDSALRQLAEASDKTAVARQLDLPLQDGRVQVQVSAADPAAAARALRAAGAEISGRSRFTPVLQSWVEPRALAALAADPAITVVYRPALAEPVHIAAGLKETEALPVMNTLAWHAAGWTGQGVKIAVIDVGFLGYKDLLGVDLPPAVTVRNFVDGQDENDVDLDSKHGAGVAEIIHDVAPSAALYFLKISTNIDLQEAVVYAHAQGVDIISTSLIWYNVTPGDGSGEFADLVTWARAQGILWITAAGNDRQRHWGQSFRDVDGDRFLDFLPGQEVNPIGPGGGQMLAGGTPIRLYLRWNDWGQPDQDLDLLLLRCLLPCSAWQEVARSANAQSGRMGQRPVEAIAYTTAGGSAYYGFAIYAAGITRSVDMDLIAAGLPALSLQTPERSLGNLADAANAITVAAVGFTPPFNQKGYSSEGPINGPGGSHDPAPGSHKPAISAYAAVSSRSYVSFGGTSAAVPHVSGAAALIRGRFPAYSAAEYRDLPAQQRPRHRPGAVRYPIRFRPSLPRRKLPHAYAHVHPDRHAHHHPNRDADSHKHAHRHSDPYANQHPNPHGHGAPQRPAAPPSTPSPILSSYPSPAALAHANTLPPCAPPIHGIIPLSVSQHTQWEVAMVHDPGTGGGRAGGLSSLFFFLVALLVLLAGAALEHLQTLPPLTIHPGFLAGALILAITALLLSKRGRRR